MTPARFGPRGHIATGALLEAVATRGPRWPAAFRYEQVTSVSEALDREVLSGNLTDAQTLSKQGERRLAEHLGRPNDLGRFDLRIDHLCAAHDQCWTIRCVRCNTILAVHVMEEDLEDRVQHLVSAHICPGSAAHLASPRRAAEPPAG